MLIRHSLLYVMVRLLAGALGMVTTAALTRILDPATYGAYGIALVIMSVGSSVIFEWLGVSFMRFYQARSGDPWTISTFAYMYTMLLVVTGGVTAVLLLTGAVPTSLRGVVASGVMLLCAYSCFELLARVEIVRFEPTRYMWMNLTRGGLTLLGAVLAAWWTHDARWTAIGTSIGMVSGALIGTSVNLRSAFVAFDRDLALEVFWFGMPLAASSILSGVVIAGIRGLVGALDSTEALGIYTAAFFMVQNTLTIVSSGLSQASYSLAVLAVEAGDMRATQRQLTANGTMLIAVMAPACLGMALTAHSISAMLVGPSFAVGVAAITPWMAAATFFCSLRFHFLDHAFQLGRRPNLLAVVAGVSAALALIAGIVLIPLFGPVGGAMAVTVAMAISCVHASIAGRKAFPMPIPWPSLLKVAACCVVMALAVLSIHGKGPAWLLVKIAAGVVAYGGCAFVLDILGMRQHLFALSRKSQRVAF